MAEPLANLSYRADLAGQEDHVAAATLAGELGALLMELRGRAKAGAIPWRTLGDIADAKANHLALDTLAKRFPYDPVRSEEAADTPGLIGAHRAWIIDPLDGTRDYVQPASQEWAVHVALVIDGVLAAGAVAVPAYDALFSTEPAPSTPAPPPTGPLARPWRQTISRSRRVELARVVAAALGTELVSAGSAGVKAMSVVTGNTDLYLHAGGMYEWDSAAPAAVAAAAGLWVSRIDGTPLRYLSDDPWLPDLLICHRSMADEVLSTVAAVQQSRRSLK